MYHGHGEVITLRVLRCSSHEIRKPGINLNVRRSVTRWPIHLPTAGGISAVQGPEYTDKYIVLHMSIYIINNEVMVYDGSYLIELDIYLELILIRTFLIAHLKLSCSKI